VGDFLDSVVEAIVDFLSRNKDAFLVSIAVSLITAIIMGALRHWWICLASVLIGAGVFGLWFMISRTE
jgi:hypothetical protein